MSNKSWRAKQARSQPKPVQELPAKVDAETLETIFERKGQAHIWDDLKRKHRGDIPVLVIWDYLADRREAVTTARSGAGLARS